MRRLFFFILLTLLLSECGLFKRTTKDWVKGQRRSSVFDQSKQLKRQFSEQQQHFVEWVLDSINKQEVVQIWPKGNFSFSPLLGFKGEAEKILILSNTQQMNRGFKLKDSLEKRTDQTKAERLIKAGNEEKKEVKTKTEAPAFWPVLGLMLIVTAGVFIFKFKTKLKKIQL